MSTVTMLNWMKLGLVWTFLGTRKFDLVSNKIIVVHAFTVSSSSFFSKKGKSLEWEGKLKMSDSNNLNDLETPEERQLRMKLVKQIQKSFYMNETGILKQGHILQEVPLWRVQWTELPGFQNVLNCHVPHYTHMFQKVLNGPKPWYFGHVYLPSGSKNLENEDYFLCSSNSKATHTGVLMQISDYKQLDDGRLLLIVQAIGKMKVTQVQQHLPFAMATVEMTPDHELVVAHYERAYHLSSTSVEQPDDSNQINHIWEAARIAAITEAMHWEPFEYRNVLVRDCIQDGGVSPLVNFDGKAEFSSLPNLDETIINALDQQTTTDIERDGGYTLSNKKELREKQNIPQNMEYVLDAERKLWIALDFMLQLLTAVNPNPTETVPVPTQILGLIPIDHQWPDGFKLHNVARKMALENAVVGTISKSPFILVDEVHPLSYPKLRRAQRLSFAIWALLDTLLVGYDPAVRTRQSVLELGSILERLEAAERGILAINKALKEALDKK